MGDRYELSLRCGGCGELDDDVYFAPSSGFLDFTCKKCKKINWIQQGFYGEVISAAELKKRLKEEGFGM